MWTSRHRGLRHPAVLAFIVASWCCGQDAPSLPELSPQDAGFSPAGLAQVDRVIEAALKAGAARGAVLLVGRDGAVVCRKAYGIHSEGRPMTTDVIFDCASLTKPVATAASIMKLVEAGQIARDDPVSRFLPGFRGHGKEAITIEQLLRHRGGLLPDNALGDYRQGPEVARRRIFDLDLRARPGAKFIYTDVGFIVLGWVVEAVSRIPLEAFAARHLFEPLGMRDTAFHPLERPLDDRRRARCAPTEPAEPGSPPLQGIVTIRDPACWAGSPATPGSSPLPTISPASR
jgi:CubicO group peptidase (beta-lactamase class C family)